jgi:hypothetical protein
MTAATPADIEFLSDPKFWETFPGFFFNDEKLLEFAEVVGVSAEYIKSKREEHFRLYLVKLSPHLHPGNDSIN